MVRKVCVHLAARHYELGFGFVLHVAHRIARGDPALPVLGERRGVGVEDLAGLRSLLVELDAKRHATLGIDVRDNPLVGALLGFVEVHLDDVGDAPGELPVRESRQGARSGGALEVLHVLEAEIGAPELIGRGRRRDTPHFFHLGHIDVDLLVVRVGDHEIGRALDIGRGIDADHRPRPPSDSLPVNSRFERSRSTGPIHRAHLDVLESGRGGIVALDAVLNCLGAVVGRARGPENDSQSECERREREMGTGLHPHG